MPKQGDKQNHQFHRSPRGENLQSGDSWKACGAFSQPPALRCTRPIWELVPRDPVAEQSLSKSRFTR